MNDNDEKIKFFDEELRKLKADLGFNVLGYSLWLKDDIFGKIYYTLRLPGSAGYFYTVNSVDLVATRNDFIATHSQSVLSFQHKA